MTSPRYPTGDTFVASQSSVPGLQPPENDFATGTSTANAPSTHHLTAATNNGFTALVEDDASNNIGNLALEDNMMSTTEPSSASRTADMSASLHLDAPLAPSLHNSPQRNPPPVEPSIPQTPPESGIDAYNPTMSQPAIQDLQSHSVMGSLAQSYGLEAFDMGMDAVLPPSQAFDSSPFQPSQPSVPIMAFAVLEFDDASFYMNTLVVTLGRDVPAYKRVLHNEKTQASQAKRAESIANGGDEPMTPLPNRKLTKYTRSVVSQSGGFVRHFDKKSERGGGKSRRSKRPGSSGSSDRNLSRRNSLDMEDGNLKGSYVPDEMAAAPVIPEELVPDRWKEDHVFIHPQGDLGSAAYKSISRKHVRIKYSEEDRCFLIEVLGANGVFINEQHQPAGSTTKLFHEDKVQIATVVVKFILPNGGVMEPEEDEEGYATTRYSENGKEMSFDFDQNPRNMALLQDTDDSDGPAILTPTGSGDDNDDNESNNGSEGQEDDEEEEEDEDEDEEGEEGIENQDDEDDEEEEIDDRDGEDINVLPSTEMMPKPERRGPGRPPKNGIMSKKKERELLREAQERAARNAGSASPTATKNKVGRPRKYPRPEDGGEPVKTEKRKYTKRKPKDPNAIGEGSPEDGREKKEKKAKPPRSPTPVFKEEDLTPEQLAKPQYNYVQLIHEALSNCPTRQMSLPQIYRSIMRKYPYFVLKAGTVGWQSSVRHNLSQHPAFYKVERDGKGWTWGIVEGASIEKEKKRRPSPPPPMAGGQGYHPQLYSGPPPPHMMQGQHQMMGPPPPGYMQGQLPPHLRQSPYPPQGQPPNGYIPPQGYPPAPLPPPPPPAQQNGYSSPYAPKPITNPAPPPQPSSLGPDRRPSAGPVTSNLPQGPPQQQPRPPMPPGPPPMPENVHRAIETFRVSLIASLKGKSDRAELVVKSAIDRVLGFATVSMVPGDPHEERIMTALRGVLSKIPGAVPPPQPYHPQGMPQQTMSQPPPRPQSALSQPGQSQPPHNANGFQPPPTAQSQVQGQTAASPMSASMGRSNGPLMPSIARPSMGGPPKPSMGGATRPPMNTPGMSRTNSGSPAPPRPVSASPAPPSTPTQTPASVATTTQFPRASPGSQAYPQANPYAAAAAPAPPAGPASASEIAAPVAPATPGVAAMPAGAASQNSTEVQAKPEPTSPVVFTAPVSSNGTKSVAGMDSSSEAREPVTEDFKNTNGKRGLSEEDLQMPEQREPEYKKLNQGLTS